MFLVICIDRGANRNPTTHREKKGSSFLLFLVPGKGDPITEYRGYEKSGIRRLDEDPPSSPLSYYFNHDYPTNPCRLGEMKNYSGFVHVSDQELNTEFCIFQLTCELE